jgi:hypothetical protein
MRSSRRAVADVTRHFKSPAVDWPLRGQAFAGQFDGPPAAARGVYVHLDMNSSPHPIFDKNGAGKVIVFGETMALKYGKFVGGLPGRMRQNYEHFHRRPPGKPHECAIFPKVLACLLVVDLGHRERDAIRSIETDWNRSIRSTLRENGLIHKDHRGRAESVNLARPITCDELLAIVEPIAAQLAM